MKYYIKKTMGFFAFDEADKNQKLNANPQFKETDLFACEDMYNVDFSCNYKIVNGEPIKKTEADLYPEKLQKAKTKKIQEHTTFLDTIIMKINGIPVWFKDELIMSLKKTADNLEKLGAQEFPLMLMEDMIFMPNGEQKTEILNTVFKIDLKEFQSHLSAMDIYAQTILLNEVKHINKINSLTKIEEVENYNITTGYPETLDLKVKFL